MSNFEVIIRKSTNTNGITDEFFSSVFWGDIYRLIFFFIVNFIGIYWKKYSVDIYKLNLSQNRNNLKKSNGMMSVIFYGRCYR